MPLTTQTPWISCETNIGGIGAMLKNMRDCAWSPEHTYLEFVGHCLRSGDNWREYRADKSALEAAIDEVLVQQLAFRAETSVEPIRLPASTLEEYARATLLLSIGREEVARIILADADDATEAVSDWLDSARTQAVVGEVG